MRVWKEKFEEEDDEEDVLDEENEQDESASEGFDTLKTSN